MGRGRRVIAQRESRVRGGSGLPGGHGGSSRRAPSGRESLSVDVKDARPEIEGRREVSSIWVKEGFQGGDVYTRERCQSASYVRKFMIGGQA